MLAVVYFFCTGRCFFSPELEDPSKQTVKLSSTGQRNNPWLTPKTTILTKHLKKTRKISDEAKMSTEMPRNVVAPPSRMLTPIVSRV